MNKIFKVIYNKAKHCYVVACEFAKSYTNGGGSRSIRSACAALCIAASIYAAAGIALAENTGGSLIGTAYVGNAPDYNVVIDQDVCAAYGRKENDDDSMNATVIINNGSLDETVCGGYSNSGIAYDNTATINGGTIIGNIYGGYAASAELNEVNVSGGEIQGFLYGGLSTNGESFGNIVKINNGTINNLEVFGGSASGGKANTNTVTIKSGNYIYVYGGSSSSHQALDNYVDFDGGKSNAIFGGKSDGTGDTNENEVTMTGGEILYDGSKEYSGNLYGGYSKDGNSAKNIVNISGDTNIAGFVFGGVASDSGNAFDNHVTIKDGTIGAIYGGYSFYFNAASNSVTISDGKFHAVYGGWTSSRDANENLVNMTGGEITYDSSGKVLNSGNLYGGYSDFEGTANNIVNISGGKITNDVYGGFSYCSPAASNSVNVSGGWMRYVFGGYSNAHKALNNIVNISGGTIDDEVYGGHSHLEANSNIVNISGGTIDYVNGGYSSSTDNAVNNTVNISGGTINHEVYGGISNLGDATSNSVSISGGTFGSNAIIYGGYVSKEDNNPSISDNIINLSSIVNGLDSAEIYGYYFKENPSTHSGNELHIGRALDYDDEGNIKRDKEGKFIYRSDSSTIWQGKSSEDTVNNLVNKVANVETLTLHSVDWNTALPALKATTIDNIDTLDITDLKLYCIGAVNETMNLLEWENEVEGVTTLKYKPSNTGDALTATFEDNASGIAVKTSEVSNTDKGIVLNGTSSGNVKKADKAVQYTINGVTLNSVDLSNWNGETSTAAATWNGTTGGVSVMTGSFNQPTNINPGESITILTTADSSFYDKNISGAKKYGSNLDDSNADSDFSDDAEKGLTFEGKNAKGVKASDNNMSLLYAVSSTKYVTDIALGTIDINEIRDMNGADYDFSKISSIDASDLIISNPDDLNKGVAVNLLSNAANLAADKTVTGSSHSQDLEQTDNDSGIKFVGEMSGSVTTLAGAVQYIQNDRVLNNIDLENWNGKNAAEVSNKWNANAVRIVGNFADPGLSEGESKNILSASFAIFKDENIDETIRYAKGSFNNALENGVYHSGYQTGGVKASDDGKELTYYALNKSINKFDLATWDGEKSVNIPVYWELIEGISIETDNMSYLPESDSEKQIFILKGGEEGLFSNVALNGENIYGKKQNKFTDSDKAESVILTGIQEKGVAFDSTKTNIIYKIGSKDVTSLKLNSIIWEDGAELLSRDKYNYSKLTSIDTKDFNITYEKPETVSVNQSMTLLKANQTLADMSALEKSVSYQYEPVSGVTMDAVIRSSLETKNGKISLTTVSNKADKLTFGDVAWMDKGALIDHKTMLNNVSFDGAAVDTTKIAFINKDMLKANMQMTLVSDFDGTPGTITGSKYKVGTAYEGEGSAYMDGSDLMFKIKTGAGLSDETHTTVMAMEAGVAMLAAGSEHVGNAIEGLSLASNAGSDGVSTFASVGGASSRYETGSHVDNNSWNCTLAVGKNLEKKDGTMEYGLFAEYGRGNYTLHMNGIADAGSGNAHYTGGGLLMKFTNKHDVYTEASYRMGSLKDKASSLLHDGAGNAYGYDISAKYRGGHIGFGKICREEGGNKLELFGKYFYNQREGINFVAGADQYAIDDVRSRILRAGFRLSSTDKKWNRYGGIAYDYEFGGKSEGTVNGNAVRAASIKGGTLRGEFGYCREATKTNPWKTDISFYGFTGQRRGFGGSVAFEYHF